MVKSFGVVLLLLLAGCSGIPQSRATASACAAGEATYACQVERYQNVSGN